MDAPHLSDGDHVRNLLGRYCERIDAGDLVGVGELFAHGRLAAGDGPAFASGSAAVAAFYAGTVALHDGSPRTKHLVVDTVLDVSAGDGTITARSSYLVLQAVDGLPLQPIIAGRYVDRFARTHTADGSWHFLERRFHVDLVGDLSHHLARPDLLPRPDPPAPPERADG